MNRKNLLIGGIITGLIACTGLSIFFTNNVDEQEQKTPTPKPTELSVPEPKKVEQAPPVKTAVTPKSPQKVELYNLEENRTLPLSAITAISALPDSIKKAVNKQLEHTNVYFLDVQDDKILIIKDANTDEERFSRHDFEIVKVSKTDGRVEKETAFPRKMSNEESEHEVWEYEVLEGDMVVPTSHKSLDEKGKVCLVEKWYYSEEDPIKYKVINKDNKTLSIRKTSANDDGNWRDEHIFYDEKGDTVLNVSTVYEDNNIARFTYYNAKNPETGVTIVNEYTDGMKTKETVYSADYKIENVYKADYENGARTGITILDGHNHPVEKLSAE